MLKKRYLEHVSCIIGLFSLVFILVFIMGTNAIAQTNSPDTTPKQGTPAIQSHSEAPEDMPASLPRPLKIGVTFMLNYITSLNEVSGDFAADIDLTLRWSDPSLAFDQRIVGANTQLFEGEALKAKLKTIWIPQITIANLEKITNIIPTLSLSSDGSAKYIQRINAIFKMKPALQAFPFDTQSLNFDLDADTNTSTEVQFVQDQSEINHSGIREGVTLNGWKLLRVDFENSLVRGSNAQFYPRFESKIIMKRLAGRHLFAFAPLLLIMLSPTLITLYSNESEKTRLTAWGAALLALIALSFTLKNQYPALESDSILPQIIGLIMFYQFLMIFLTVTVLNSKFTFLLKNRFIRAELISYFKWAVPVGFFLLIVSSILLTGTGF